mgnify:FL=1
MAPDYSKAVPFVILIVIVIVVAVAVLLIKKAISYQRAHPFESNVEQGQLPDKAYCDMVKHVLLLVFTFGVWYCIWIYRVTGYLNAAKGEAPRNPLTKLLLCMFVPFYGIYWTYKSAQRIDQLAKIKNITSDCATLCLILAIFIPIVAPLIMQDKMNTITKN